MNTEFRLLRADEIELRVGQVSQKTGKKSLLLYKDARVDMRLLDEQIGASNWQREHILLDGVLYCKVSIWDSEKGQWISKMDAGERSNRCAEKGQASDAFKRACFSWGIGRELYTAPQVWIDGNINEGDLFVSLIEYDASRKITDLAISNKRTKQVVWTNRTTQSAVKTQGKPAGAVYTHLRYEDLTEREQNELDDARAQMDFAQDLQSLYRIANTYKDARFAHLLNAHGKQIKEAQGWQ